MTMALPQVRVGDPLRHESLAVFPLFAEVDSQLDYLLSEEALADSSVIIEEVSEGGSVPDLLVENKGDLPVLFLEGEELVGAKQNRILNTSVLVAAHSKIKIPVSCVEQGRWAYRTKCFELSGSHVPSNLRRALKSSVSRAVRESRGHRSDQGEVWNQVSQLHAAHGVASRTAAMSDAFEMHQEGIASYQENLKYTAGAVGVAIAIGGRVISVDVFDKPQTCEKVWNRLLSGVVFDALAAGTSETTTKQSVEQFLADAGEMPWQEAQAAGIGDEYRAESPRGDHASALAVDGTVVHGSLVAAE